MKAKYLLATFALAGMLAVSMQQLPLDKKIDKAGIDRRARMLELLRAYFLMRDEVIIYIYIYTLIISKQFNV